MRTFIMHSPSTVNATPVDTLCGAFVTYETCRATMGFAVAAG
jgi:hypothetical protein